MKVAKSESTFSTPTLAKIAVSAAKAAESSAQSCHDASKDIMSASLRKLPNVRQLRGVGHRLTSGIGPRQLNTAVCSSDSLSANFADGLPAFIRRSAGAYAARKRKLLTAKHRLLIDAD